MKIVITEFCGLGNSVLLSDTFFFLNESGHDIKLIGSNKFGGLEIYKYNKNLKISYYKFYQIIKNIKDVYKSDLNLIPHHSSPPFIFLIIIFFFTKKNLVISEYFFRNMNKIKLFFLNFILFVRSVFFFQLKIKKINVSELHHEKQINFNFINNLIKKKFKIENNTFYFPKNYKNIEKYNLKKNSYFVFQISAANGSKTPKIWPTKNFIHLFELISAKYNNDKIVIIGDKGDLNYIQKFKTNNKLIDLRGKTSIDELISILIFSKFVICNDSSILHLSDALNIKNISLFGPTNFKKNYPTNKNSLYINKNLPCSPCMGWNSKIKKNISELQAFKSCAINFKCMSSILPEEVISLMQKNLS